MADNNSPKPPQKKTKSSTLVLESCAMWITNQDNLQDVMEASEFKGDLSPLGWKLTKKRLKTAIPLNPNAINQMVLEKDGGYLDCPGMPKRHDVKVGVGDNEQKEEQHKDNRSKERTLM